MMAPMVVGLLLGLVASRWLWQAADDRTLTPLLPGAWSLVLCALVVLVVGLLMSAVAPRLGAGLAAGLLPGIAIAARSLDAYDHERSIGLLAVGLAVAIAGVSCAVEAHEHPHGAAHP
jgi:hypothetical protein